MNGGLYMARWDILVDSGGLNGDDDKLRFWIEISRHDFHGFIKIICQVFDWISTDFC